MSNNLFNYEEFFEHFSPGISDKILTYANEQVFRSSRYIFTHRKGNRQYGYCTYCHSEFETKGLKHNKLHKCPACQSDCIVKSSGRKRSRLVDDAYFIYFEKSIKNPAAIVARGILAVRDYTGDYHNVETKYLETALYVFEMGNSRMVSRYAYYSMAKTMKAHEYQACASIYSVSSSTYMSNKAVHMCCFESIAEAVKGTPFQYSTWEEYKQVHMDIVKFFDLYSKYPCIEYLTKLGFGHLVQDKLAGNRTFGAINWRGENLYQVLKLTKADLREIKKLDTEVSFLFLRLLQISRKDDSNLSLSEIADINKKYYWHYDDLVKVLKYTSLRQATSYLKAQQEKQLSMDNPPYPPYRMGEEQILITWRDYIDCCLKLEMDLSRKNVLFPRNLHRAHQGAIKQIRLRADEVLNQKIESRLKNLRKKYCFEKSGLLIRPAASTNELINEGKRLQHCVGTYAQNYAEGRTVLLLIRKSSKPDKPYFTMEIIDDRIVQCRGLRNCRPNKEVAAFVEAFKAAKIDKKPAKQRIRVSA